MALRVVEQAACTDVGRQRDANEDASSSRPRRCSRSPTGWAARTPARSRRGSRSRRFEAARDDDGTPEEQLDAARRARPTAASTSWRRATSRGAAWARR